MEIFKMGILAEEEEGEGGGKKEKEKKSWRHR